MNEIANFAKKAVEYYLLNSKPLGIGKAPERLLTKRAGCFVSIHSKDNGKLRGCIGTIMPTCKNIAAEISQNSISACNDFRFEKISQTEIGNLSVSVDILQEPEKIDSPIQLDPKKYGVIVRSEDGRTGLLLPDLDGINGIDEQINIAREKAEIMKNEPITLYRFKAERFHEQ